MVAFPLACPVMVTACGVEKLELKNLLLKVSVAGLTVTVLVSLLVMARVKLPKRLKMEFRVRATVYVVVPPATYKFAWLAERVKAGVLLFTMVNSAMLLKKSVKTVPLRFGPALNLVLPCICMTAPLAISKLLEPMLRPRPALNAS